MKKKFFPLLCGVLLLAACAENTPEQVENEKVETVNSSEGDTSVKEGTPEAATIVVPEHCPQLELDWSEIAFVKEQFIIGVEVGKEPTDVVVLGNLQRLDELMFSLNNEFFALENYDELNSLFLSGDGANECHEALTSMLGEKGYVVGSAEGSIYLSLTGEYIQKDLQEHVDSLGWRFIQLYTEENDEPCCEDAGIMLNHKELVIRVVQWAEMKEESKGTAYEEYALARYRQNLYFLLAGLDNTPSFAFEDGKYNAYYFDDMNEWVVNQPEHPASKDFAPFLEMLKSSGMKETEEIRAYIQEVSL